MYKEFSDQTVVVTGASAGLGRAIVREFAEKGANIGLLARGLEGLEGAKREVEAKGGRALIMKTDVSDPDQVEEAARQVEAQLGPIDIWINNAMVSVFSEFKDMHADEYKRVTEVTYLGQVYGTMIALKKMRPRNKGSIILIGSALAYRGIPLQSAYCGAKHAIHGFFESLRSELIHDNSRIHLSMIQMPAMNTPQFIFVKNKLSHKPRPMGKIYGPDLAAKAVTYVAAHPCREFNVGYTTRKTILGNKVCPGYLDHYLAQTAYSGQQTRKPAGPEDKNNLWEPLRGDYGATGGFDRETTHFSLHLWLTRHKKLALAGVLIATGLANWAVNSIRKQYRGIE